ncbi:MAG: DHH family phosphoesterase [Bacillota bacterium]|nr:DHH family phosphoesterase [Bacillota bacterium]
MKQFKKYRSLMFLAGIATVVSLFIFCYQKRWDLLVLVLVLSGLSQIAFFGFWKNLHDYGMKTEVDISRVLGKDAKGALQFGNVGIITYDENYIVTWCSSFFSDRKIDLVGKKVTSWIPEVRKIFDEVVDEVYGRNEGTIYQIIRKTDTGLLYVKDVTELYELKEKYENEQLVVGVMTLDNYMEYQAYEQEEIISKINTNLRGPLVSWANAHDMMIRRLRSDRFMLVLDQKILKKIRAENFDILQKVKDEANRLDVSITLSMAFAYGSNNLKELDSLVNELLELAQSRGGDQTALKKVGGQVEFIGGNSETSSTRSKVRVRIMANSIQSAIRECPNVYIVGHKNTDFDCMGAALAMSSWVKTIKESRPYIVLKGVSRDKQLQECMERYKDTINSRHTLLTPEQAREQINPEKDLVIMVDHGIACMSSGDVFLDRCKKIIVLDHHRRGEAFVKNAMLTYVESGASSACELITELIQNIPDTVPIYEAEATVMYLGVLVDTNRFKMHSDTRTFEAVAALRSWGANPSVAELILKEDYDLFTIKNDYISRAKRVHGRFVICCIDDVVQDRTILAQISQQLLSIKGAQATFTIGQVSVDPVQSAISARSDSSFNVQRVMEKMNGGGHFTAAAVQKPYLPNELAEQLERILEEEENESNIA